MLMMGGGSRDDGYILNAFNQVWAVSLLKPLELHLFCPRILKRRFKHKLMLHAQ